MDFSFYEIIGYFASLLVAVSLMMSSILRLRLINLGGAITFAIYGLLIRSYPVAIVNIFIILIDIYYLYELTNTSEYFKFLEMRPTSNYLLYFLQFHHSEIARYSPEYQFKPRDTQIIFFILRNLVPAGLFIGEIQSDGWLKVELDYVIPGYRDLKVGRYLYQQKEFFNALGIHRIVSVAGSQKHEKYLKRMGFSKYENILNATSYILNL